jgi:hypothetical protein
MPGVARLRSKQSDNFSVLDNYGLPHERTIARFGNDGKGWRNMRKCLSELSLRGRRALFLSKLALSPRQCGKHRHNPLIVRGYQLDMRIVKLRQPLLLAQQERNPFPLHQAANSARGASVCLPSVRVADIGGRELDESAPLAWIDILWSVVQSAH